ncbi:MAG: GxxExxY protein [Candidatus Didemnitutus sp.]|nr:GxxExxY protein [Candidatus Didemnitutus sp.]
MSTEPMQQEGYDFMAAAFAVYNELGNGYTEDVYQEALELELTERAMPFQSQAELTICYRGRPLRRRFRPDLVVCEGLVVELKAVAALAPEHEAQVLNYLKATGKPVGYLVNFGHREKLEWKRFARTRKISVNERKSAV